LKEHGVLLSHQPCNHGSQTNKKKEDVQEKKIKIRVFQTKSVAQRGDVSPNSIQRKKQLCLRWSVD